MTVRRAVVLLLVASLAAAAGARAAGEPSRATGADVAKVVTLATVRARPGAGPIVRLLATRTSWGEGPQQLLVLGSRIGPDGHEWLRVRLPGRPNGSAGWIRRDVALVHHDPWWIDVSLAHRLVRVYRAGVLVRRFEAVVGAPRTPTPIGLFAVYELDAQPSPSGFVGAWVIQLTAFSDVLDDYGGGPGRVAIHGRGGASLADPLGTARSHGCIRLDNGAVEWLAGSVPAGTPVRIHV